MELMELSGGYGGYGGYGYGQEKELPWWKKIFKS